MTISELGSIGEFVASIAVLITLIVLVVETRNNTKILIRANARATYDQEGDALRAAMDGEIAEIYIRGHNEGLDSLTPVERYRFDLTLVTWLHAVESAYDDYRDGYYPADKLEPFENAVAGFLTTPGGSVWWRERQYWFGPGFRDEVERILAADREESKFSGPKPPSADA
jgi:hypothetical protein